MEKEISAIKILLLEDNPTDQAAFKRLVKKENLPYEYVITASVSEAKSILHKQEFDIVLADYCLSDGIGLDLLSDIGDKPFVLITGSGNEEIAITAMKAGATDYLIKDVSGVYPTMLSISVDNALAKKRAQIELKQYQEHLEELVDERTKALRESEEKYRAIFENSGTALVFIGEDSTILICNKEFETLSGYSHAELEGKVKWTKFVTAPEDLERMKEYHRSRRIDPASVSQMYEFQFVDRKGHLKNVVITVVMLPGTKQSLASFMDITVRKKAEEELRKYREHLEELVQQRTNELKEANEELVRKEKLAILGQLTAVVSHELRNPLGTIRNSIYEMNERLRGKNSGLEKALDRAERNIVRCDKIIEELLDYTRETEHTTVQLLIDKWIGGFLDEIIIHKNIKLQRKLNAGVEVNINPDSFRRCLINLIDNAVQAMNAAETERKSKEGITVPNEIIIETSIEEAGLLIKIKDSGPGISREELNKIFEPLYSTKGFGVGLGLPIVKKIIEQHHGSIEIISEIGRGTIAILRLPII